MTFSELSAFFEQSVPLGVVAIIVFQAVMSRDIKHIRKDLDNHITDTNKKLETLIEKIDTKFDKIFELIAQKKP